MAEMTKTSASLSSPSPSHTQKLRHDEVFFRSELETDLVMCRSSQGKIGAPRPEGAPVEALPFMGFRRRWNSNARAKPVGCCP